MEIHQQVKNQQTSNFQDFPEKLAMRPPFEAKELPKWPTAATAGLRAAGLGVLLGWAVGAPAGDGRRGPKTNKQTSENSGFWGQKPTKKKTSWGFNQSNI